MIMPKTKPVICIEVDPSWAEYEVLLDDGNKIWVLEEDLEKEAQ